MDTRLTTTHVIWRLLTATFVALALLVMLGATSASAASPTACRVRNAETGKTYKALQDAVDAASGGDRLSIKGTCIGTTVLDKGLVIEGLRSSRADEPVLDADQEGCVLTVRKGVTSSVVALTIENGRGRQQKDGPRTPWLRAAGVENHGKLTLHDVLVRGNVGLGVRNTGGLRLNGATVIGRNGIRGANEYHGVLNTGTLRLSGTATIRKNSVAVKNRGTLVLSGSSSLHNNGLAIENLGAATLNDNSRIDDFGQVMNAGVLTLDDSSQIRGLYRPHTRGFVGVANTGTLTLYGASLIHDNAVGVQNEGSLTLNETSEISGNSRGVDNRGSVTLNGSGTIHDNHLPTPIRCGPLGSGCGPIGGAGVWNSGSLTLNDSSSIFANTVGDWHARSVGGGVYLFDDSSPGKPSLTMTGSSSIRGNRAGDSGGGLFAGAGSVLTGVSCGPQTLANVYGNTPDDCHFEP